MALRIFTFSSLLDQSFEIIEKYIPIGELLNYYPFQKKQLATRQNQVQEIVDELNHFNEFLESIDQDLEKALKTLDK